MIASDLAALLRRAWHGSVATIGRSAPSAFFRRADRYRNEGRYEEAARLVAQGLREDPGSGVGHLLSAYLHVANRAMDLAKTEFRRVLKLDPFHPRALLGLARISLEEHDPDGAKRLLDRALQYYSEFPEARALREMVGSWAAAPAATRNAHLDVTSVDHAAAAERDVVVTRMDGSVAAARVGEERAAQVARHLVQVCRMASATLGRAGCGGLRRGVIDTGSSVTVVLADHERHLSATVDGNVEIGAGLAQAGRLWAELGVNAGHG